MYKSIAKYYDYIFPPNTQQVKFINSVSPFKKDEFIMEIGCATGNLTALLGLNSNNVTGVDLSKNLLEKAKEKSENIDYIQANMLEINNINKNFDKIICFGNTIAHLNNIEEVYSFFKLVYSKLRNNQFFLGQIINYDRILDSNIKSLKTIENKHIKFIRKYKKHKEKILFNTELLIKNKNEKIKNSVELLPLRNLDIKKGLAEANFKDINFYGDFSGSVLNNNSVPLIFSCKKY